MTVAVNFRTDDPSRWGAGNGAGPSGVLTADQADLNVWNLKVAVEALEANPAQPVGLSGVTVSGMFVTFTLTDGNSAGPFPLPVLVWRMRGTWTPDTLYAELDVFSVAGLGLYLVLLGHTSAATFDPGATDPATGKALYQLILSAGGLVAPYVASAPADGSTVTAGSGELRRQLRPAAELAALTVILPPSPGDGQVYEIATRQTIDALSVLPASSETVDGGGPFMLAANGGASWLYSADDTTWSRRY